MSTYCSVLPGSGQLFRRGIDGAGWLARLAVSVLLAAALLSTSFAQTGRSVTVRVLNAKTGRPLKGVGVFLVDSNRTAGKADPAAGAPHGLSSSDGAVALRLPVPTPEKILVWYSGGQCGLAQCSYNNGAPFSTADILKTGVVAPNGCLKGRNTPYSVVAKPGEIVIFGAPLSWWDCVKREIP